MADPKFANLPGIAYDQPDVYETPDAPEKSAPNYYEDTDTECIERLHFSTDNSNNKFKGKYLTGHIDYSHHDKRGGCWELAGQGERETPMERYRRIKCEIDELMNEIVDLNINATISKKQKESYEATVSTVNSAQKVLCSLKLDNVVGCETVPSTSDNEIKKLLAQIEGFRKNETNQILNESSKNQMEYTKRIAELEARLHNVETIIGAQQPDKLNRLASTFDTSTDTLLDAVQQMSTKAALLQPAQLDQIEDRISALNDKLNTINEKALVINGKSGPNDDTSTDLYRIVKKVEPISKLLPNMLHRMQTLETLHNHANNFSKTIAELEATQSAIVSSLNGNKVLLQIVQETFCESNEVFSSNLENVGKKIEKLELQLKASEKK